MQHEIVNGRRISVSIQQLRNKNGVNVVFTTATALLYCSTTISLLEEMRSNDIGCQLAREVVLRHVRG